MKELIKTLLYPLSIVFGMMAAYQLYQSGTSFQLSLFFTLLPVNIMLFLMERWIPFQKQWKYGIKEFTLNIFHQMTNSLLIIPLAKFCMENTVTHFHTFNIWPSQAPFVLQVILAILIADLSIYLSHRWMHSTKIGWRIHVVHHTTTKMNFLAASRSHPFNAFLVYSLEVGILLLLGVTGEVLITWTAFMSIVGLFSHTNLDLRLSFFNKFLSTADVHRVHHDLEWDHSNSNYGNTTCLWDRVFGTFILPEEKITQQGLKEYSIPPQYHQHLLAPFTLKRFANKN
jgi:sterol desaturase/sphingolipid hydroxylase (fatty acid hydroxylase superfamily)